ncbi:MAG: HAD family hydrolase [Opitutales bacterium]
MIKSNIDHIVFDWGDTIMKDDLSRTDAMYLWPQVEVVEAGMAETLAGLAASYTLVIATRASASDEAMVRKALTRVRVDHWFSHVFTALRTGGPKTDPRFWQFIMQELGLGSDRLLVVGDNFASDVLVPTRLGIQAVWFNWRSSEERAGENYHTIHRLSELIA